MSVLNALTMLSVFNVQLDASPLTGEKSLFSPVTGDLFFLLGIVVCMFELLPLPLISVIASAM